MRRKILKSTTFILTSIFFSFGTVPDRGEIEAEKFAPATKKNSYSQTNTLSNALTFHASFDHGPDASFGAGDKKIYTGDFKGSRQQNEIPTTVGLGTPPLLIAKGRGKYGDALEFKKDNSHVVFYRLDKNIQDDTR